jgi:hypothetical protein
MGHAIQQRETGMTRSRRGRWTLIARGVLLLAALLLLPLAAMLQMPRQTAAQSAGQDSLWAGSGGSVGACADPSSSASLSGCFASAATTWSEADVAAVATDGVNVYFATEQNGAWSCPIADLGANCTQIMAGPWPPQSCGVSACPPVALAAANGYLWIGQYTGQIYRCPSNLPYFKQKTAPSECVLLDDAGHRPVYSLLLANGTLYAGLGPYKKQGLLWSCSPNIVDSCSTLDSYGNTAAASLAAGGGYLWAGLYNGIVWRCDLNATNACDNWENAGNDNVVNSISYDGQGTLYAAIKGNSNTSKGVIWSCPTAYANGCGNLIANVYGRSVAAGAGSVFSSASPGGLHYGTSPFTAASSTWQSSLLLYLPADGPVGVGGVKVTMIANRLNQKLETRCDQSPANKIRAASVTVTGPNGFAKTLRFDVCTLSDAAVTRMFDLLDPGDYRVTVQAGKHSGEASFTIVPDKTKPVNVKLTRGIRD